MTSTAGIPAPHRAPLVAPSVEEWHALTSAERERLLVAVNEALSEPLEAMSAGRPYKKAKGRAIDVLSLHFGSTGRAVYLAEEMAVLYPGEPTFSPDVIAIAGVPQPEEGRARLEACDDVAVLHRRLISAAMAGSLEEVLSA